MPPGRLQVRVGGREAVLGAGLGEVAVGSERGCLVRVAGDGVGARHAVLRPEGGGWVLVAVEAVFADGRAIGRLAVDAPLSVRLGDAAAGVVLELSPADGDGAGALTGDWSAAATPHEPVRAPEATSYLLPETVLRIGRDPEGDVVVGDLLASRHHAEVRRLPDGRFEVADLASHNGTYVNGRRVERAVLAERDVVGVGRNSYRLIGRHLEEHVDTGEVAYAARSLSVRLPGGQTIVDDVSFSLPSSSLLAIVGPSGSGKSTLVDALTGERMAGDGDVLYDDRSLYANYAALRRRIGHVPQGDLAHGGLTVAAALDYEARLRLPADVGVAERRGRVRRVLDELGLTDRAGTRIDVLSGGERRRVNVGLELLTEPAMLFLDEPTTGLDPHFEGSLMALFRRLADGGRTIILVTHSTESLALCDRVLVLAPGGRPAFFGPPQLMAAYFGAARLAEVFTALTEEAGENWARRFREHGYHAAYVERDGADAAPAAPARAAERPPRVGPRAWWRQAAALSGRSAAVLAADRRNLALLGLQAPVLGLLLLAALPAHELAATPASQVRLVSQAGLVLLVVVLGVTWLGLSNAAREIAKELPVYRRERAAGLSASAYVASKALVLGTLTAAQTIVVVLLATARQHGPRYASALGWPLGELLVIAVLAALVAMSVGLLVSALARTVDRAATVLPVLLVFELVLALGGVFPSVGDAPVLKQLGYADPVRWAFAGAASTADLNDLAAVTGVLTRTRTVSADDPTGLFRQFARGSRGDPLWDHDASAWLTDAGVLIALAALALLATVLALRREDARPRRRGRAPAVGATVLAAAALAGCASYPPAERAASPRRCAAGTPACLDVVVAEMSRRLDPLTARCDHLAPFALMYLDLTREVRAGVRGARYQSPAYVTHLDAVFASLYFRALDAWRGGRRDAVPRAWRLAFAAARDRRVTVLGDMLLGMNAHISRDLPYALAAVGLRLPGGAPATSDVRAIDGDIARTQARVLADEARRFDPRVAAGSSLAGWLRPRQVPALIAAWRAEALANARRLLDARSTAARRHVEAEIDANAALRGLFLWRATAATPARARARDGYCAAS